MSVIQFTTMRSIRATSPTPKYQNSNVYRCSCGKYYSDNRNRCPYCDAESGSSGTSFETISKLYQLSANIRYDIARKDTKEYAVAA